MNSNGPPLKRPRFGMLISTKMLNIPSSTFSDSTDIKPDIKTEILPQSASQCK